MKSRSIALAFCAVLMGLVATATAQPLMSDHVTPGGLAFRYTHLPNAPAETIQFGWVDAYTFSGKAQPGVAFLGPQLILQGPQGLPRGEYVEELKDLQARLQLSSTPGYTMGGLTAPDAKFDDAVDLFAKVLGVPALEPARLDELRAQRLAALRPQAASPSMLASWLAGRVLYGEGPVRDWHTGATSIYESISIEDIRQWRAKVFTRQSLLIAAAGRSSPQVAARRIDKLFEDLPAGEAQAAGAFASQGSPRMEMAGTIVLESAVAQTHLQVIGWSGFAPDADLLSGQIAARVLRMRVFGAVRERLGASYGASVQLFSPIPGSYAFSISSAVAHDKGQEALAAIKAQFEALIDQGVTGAELEAEKSRMMSELQEMFRRPASVAALVRNGMLTGRAPDHVATSLERLAKLDLATVNEAIRRHLRGRAFATVVVAPSATPFAPACTISNVQPAACP